MNKVLKEDESIKLHDLSVSSVHNSVCLGNNLIPDAAAGCLPSFAKFCGLFDVTSEIIYGCLRFWNLLGKSIKYPC